MESSLLTEQLSDLVALTSLNQTILFHLLSFFQVSSPKKCVALQFLPPFRESCKNTGFARKERRSSSLEKLEFFFAKEETRTRKQNKKWEKMEGERKRGKKNSCSRSRNTEEFSTSSSSPLPLAFLYQMRTFVAGFAAAASFKAHGSN